MSLYSCSSMFFAFRVPCSNSCVLFSMFKLCFCSFETNISSEIQLCSLVRSKLNEKNNYGFEHAKYLKHIQMFIEIGCPWNCKQHEKHKVFYSMFGKSAYRVREAPRTPPGYQKCNKHRTKTEPEIITTKINKSVFGNQHHKV